MPERFGYGFDDLPEGALGFPEVIYEDLTTPEEIMEVLDADTDDASTEYSD